MKSKTGDRKGIPPTASPSSSGVTGEIMKKSLCSESLVFNGEKTTLPKVIRRDEYDHMDRIHQCICDAAVADGAFVILEK